MRKLFLLNISVILIGLSIGRTQNSIKVVDNERIINSLKEKKILDSIYESIEYRLYQMGESWVKYFQIKQLKIIEGVTCSTPDKVEEVERKL